MGYYRFEFNNKKYFFHSFTFLLKDRTTSVSLNFINYWIRRVNTDTTIKKKKKNNEQKCAIGNKIAISNKP